MVVKQSVASVASLTGPSSHQGAAKPSTCMRTAGPAAESVSRWSSRFQGPLRLGLQAAFCAACPLMLSYAWQHCNRPSTHNGAWAAAAAGVYPAPAQHVCAPCFQVHTTWAMLGRQLSSRYADSSRACRQLASRRDSSMLAGGQAGCRDMSPPACRCSSCTALACGGSCARCTNPCAAAGR